MINGTPRQTRPARESDFGELSPQLAHSAQWQRIVGSRSYLKDQSGHELKLIPLSDTDWTPFLDSITPARDHAPMHGIREFFAPSLPASVQLDEAGDPADEMWHTPHRTHTAGMPRRRDPRPVADRTANLLYVAGTLVAMAAIGVLLAYRG